MNIVSPFDDLIHQIMVYFSLFYMLQIGNVNLYGLESSDTLCHVLCNIVLPFAFGMTIELDFIRSKADYVLEVFLPG